MSILRTLYDIFNYAAERCSNKPAVCFKSTTQTVVISYQQILDECEKVSKTLIELNITGFIGVSLEQSAHLPTVLLGITRSGLAFTCLHMDFEDWNQNILKRLNIRFLFSDTKKIHSRWRLRKELVIHGCTVILWEHTTTDASFEENVVKWNQGDWRMAYAIQTSGTTGQPKIIRVPHRCIVPNIQHLQSVLSVNSNDVIFLTAPSTFDPSIVEMFLAFSVGAILLVASHDIKSAPNLLLKMLFSDTQYRVTILEATPSFVKRWSKTEIQETILSEKSSLRILILGGEPCPSVQNLRQWKAKGNRTDIFNIYGITEISCWASIYKILFQDRINLENELNSNTSSKQDLNIPEESITHIKAWSVPLGSTMSHTSFRVKDDSGEDISTGEGELHIGSMERICLVDNEAIENLIFPVYRATGDIVKIDESSKEIFYIGRKGNMIKRFGHRVCLDKVEQIASSKGSIEECCCVWNEDIGKLGLFVRQEQTGEEEQDFDRELKLILLEHLHPSCIPDVIIRLHILPLTGHGKIDRYQLKHLLIDEVQKDVKKLREVRNASQIFSSLWRKHLCFTSDPNPDDKFVNAGGNSFIALQLVSELEEILGTSLYSGLIGLLLGGSTFKECCTYLFFSNQFSYIKSSTVVSMPESSISMLDHSHCISKSRKRSKDTDVFGVHDHDNFTKITKRKVEEGIKSVPDIEVGKGDCDVCVTSSCRGKIQTVSTLETISTILETFNRLELKVRWKFNLGKCVDASPRFLQYRSGQERVLVGSHSHLFTVIDSKNASLVAKCNLLDRIESSVCTSHCGKYGVVGSYNGCVYCIELNTGEVTWSHQTAGMVKSSPSLCLKQSAVVVGSYDHTLYCFNVEDGHLHWSAKFGSGSIYSSPCVSILLKTLYVAALDGTCAALAEDTGQILWTCKFSSPVFSSPALLLNESAILFAEVSGLVHCLSPEEGKEMWNFQAGGYIFSSFCVLSSGKIGSDIILFGCHDEKLYCLEGSARTVILRWTCELGSPVFSTPFIFPALELTQVESTSQQTVKRKSDLFYLVSAAATNGKVYVLDFDSGAVKCFYQLPGEVFSSPVVNRNHIYVGCRDNNVYCLEITAV